MTTAKEKIQAVLLQAQFKALRDATESLRKLEDRSRQRGIGTDARIAKMAADRIEKLIGKEKVS